MKGKLIAVALSMSILLSGCSVVGLDAQNLMRPPKATGERQSVYEKLEETAGSGFTLKYPRTGDNRSAIIMHDITGDGNDDAIALYQQASTDEEVGCTLAVFSEKEGEWQVVGAYNNVSTQVDRISFADLNYDGRDEIIVGWGNSVTGSSELCVYFYTPDGQLREPVSKQYYDEMVVEDFDVDGNAEIFLARLSKPDMEAKSIVLGLSESGSMEVYGSVAMDSSVTKYNHISVGSIDENTRGVMLDGAKSASTVMNVTEIIYWDKTNQVLKSLYDTPESQQQNVSIRKSQIYSRDINGDGILEFPVMTAMPGSGPDAEDTAYLTNWQQYNTATGLISNIATWYINLTDGYSLVMPKEWIGQVTVKADTGAHSLTFYEWQKNDTGGVLGASLLKIQAMSRKEWDGFKDKTGMQELGRPEEDGTGPTGDTVCVASFPNPSNPLALAGDQVDGSFAWFSQS